MKKNDSVSKGLIHAQQGGLIKKQDYQFAKSLVDTIENKINQIDLNECGYEELLTIFDLIQGWGGQQCRPTYYPKKKKLPKTSIDLCLDLASGEYIDYQGENDKVESELDKLHWYDKKVYNLIQDEYSITELSNKTNITYHSLYNTFRKVKKALKDKVKD